MKKLKIALVVLVTLFVVIQLVPYGRGHENPPVVSEPSWNAEKTRELFFTACADCHSNETDWPWYSHVAPVSWLVTQDVEEAREHFNVSEWGLDRHNEGDEAAEMVREGEMPLQSYLLAHPEARLSQSEEQALIDGLAATFGDEASGHDDHEDHEH